MATKKSKIKFEQPKAAPPCRSKCGKISSIEGWCTVCYAKFRKGFYTAEGQISPEVLRKQKEVEQKRAKKIARKITRRQEEVKEALSTKLAPNHLRILQDEHPESSTQHYCERLSFWTSDTVCYSRLFISKNKKCFKCKVHNEKFEELLVFVEKIDEQSSQATTPEVQATVDQTTATTSGPHDPGTTPTTQE